MSLGHTACLAQRSFRTCRCWRMRVQRILGISDAGLDPVTDPRGAQEHGSVWGKVTNHQTKLRGRGWTTCLGIQPYSFLGLGGARNRSYELVDANAILCPSPSPCGDVGKLYLYLHISPSSLRRADRKVDEACSRWRRKSCGGEESQARRRLC